MKPFFFTLAAFTGLAMAADAPKNTEAPLSKAQKIALQSIVDQRSELSKKDAVLLQEQNEVVAETCVGLLKIPTDKLVECQITADLSKAVWVKPPAEPKKAEPAPAKPSSETTKPEDPKGK